MRLKILGQSEQVRDETSYRILCPLMIQYHFMTVNSLKPFNEISLHEWEFSDDCPGVKPYSPKNQFERERTCEKELWITLIK